MSISETFSTVVALRLTSCRRGGDISPVLSPFGEDRFAFTFSSYPYKTLLLQIPGAQLESSSSKPGTRTEYTISFPHSSYDAVAALVKPFGDEEER